MKIRYRLEYQPGKVTYHPEPWEWWSGIVQRAWGNQRESGLRFVKGEVEGFDYEPKVFKLLDWEIQAWRHGWAPPDDELVDEIIHTEVIT